jgi:hypothetical protein
MRTSDEGRPPVLLLVWLSGTCIVGGPAAFAAFLGIASTRHGMNDQKSHPYSHEILSKIDRRRFPFSG